MRYPARFILFHLTILFELIRIKCTIWKHSLISGLASFHRHLSVCILATILQVSPSTRGPNVRTRYDYSFFTLACSQSSRVLNSRVLSWWRDDRFASVLNFISEVDINRVQLRDEHVELVQMLLHWSINRLPYDILKLNNRIIR